MPRDHTTGSGGSSQEPLGGRTEDDPGGRASSPLVSVVVPFKDAAVFLGEAVDSALAQSWPNLEVVLVDDGGTDGSEAIALEYQSAHPDRVRVRAHEGRVNCGIGPSRAFGIRQTRGEIVAFLDADDVWEPAHVEEYVRLLLLHPEADMVCGRYWFWHSWADPRMQDRLSELAFAPTAVIAGPRLLTAVLRNGNFATSPCSVVARKQALLGCLGSLEAFPGMYEDQVMNSWLQLRASVVMTGATTAWYRQHDDSFSARDHAHTERRHRSRIVYLAWLQSQVNDLQIGDPEVRELVQRSLEEAQARDTRAASSVMRRALRALLPADVRDRAGVVRQVLTLTPPVSPAAHAHQVDRILFRYGADIRGDVLLFGDGVTDTGVDGRATSVQFRAWPGPVVSPGPHHALASLGSGAYDCIIVLAAPDGVGTGDLGFRHLRRALRPAGVLLVVLPHHDDVVAGALRAEFGRDALTLDHPGPRPRTAVALRAAIPAA